MLLTEGGGERTITCDICMQTYHQKCTAMNAKVFDRFIVNVKVTGWVCEECKIAARTHYQRLATAVAHLAEELAALKCEMTAANITTKATSNDESSNNTVHPSSNDIDNHMTSNEEYEARTTLIVQRTLNDATRRKRNVVISGLPESDESDDRTKFLNLCEGYLTIKPLVSDSGFIRLGAKQPNKHRRLLVKLNSEEVATTLLQTASQLRNSAETAHIYINEDLSPAAAKLAFEARKARREAKERRQHQTRDNIVRDYYTAGSSRSTDEPPSQQSPLLMPTQAAAAAAAVNIAAATKVNAANVQQRVEGDQVNRPVTTATVSSQRAAANNNASADSGDNNTVETNSMSHQMSFQQNC